jgi:hypothetical protein
VLLLVLVLVLLLDIAVSYQPRSSQPPVHISAHPCPSVVKPFLFSASSASSAVNGFLTTKAASYRRTPRAEAAATVVERAARLRKARAVRGRYMRRLATFRNATCFPGVIYCKFRARNHGKFKKSHKLLFYSYLRGDLLGAVHRAMLFFPCAFWPDMRRYRSKSLHVCQINKSYFRNTEMSVLLR